MSWYTQMGRRVLIHEFWNFFFRDRRINNGPTLKQFWGESQEDQEIPLRLLAKSE